MSTETATKSEAQKRKGRLYKQICYGLSWHCSVQVHVPPALWALLGHGWPYGPLVKSSSGIQDPDLPGVTWNAWLFAAGMVMVKSNQPNTPFIWLYTIGDDARANPADNPTAGL